MNLNKDGINGFKPKSDSNEGGHVARCGPHIQLKFKLGQKGNEGKKRAHSLVLIMRERRRGKEESQASSHDLQSSVGLRTKVHHIDKRYAWVPKNRDFVEDPKGRIQEIEVVGFRRLPTYLSHF